MPARHFTARRGHKAHRPHRATKRARTAHKKVAHVKSMAGFFPKVCHTVAVLNTDYLPLVSGGNQGQLTVPLNSLYRPFNWVRLAGGPGSVTDCAPYLYLQTGANPTTGLLGSSATTAAYRQYKVLGCKVKYEIVNRYYVDRGDIGAPDFVGTPVRFQGYLNPPTANVGTGPPSFLNTINVADNQRHHWDVMVPAPDAQNKPTIVTKYFSAKTMFQRTREQIDSDWGDEQNIESIAVSESGVGSGAYGTGANNLGENPPWESYLQAQVRDIDGGSLPSSSVSVRISMKWWIQLFGQNFITTISAPTKGPDPEEKKDDDDDDPPVVVPPSSAAAPPNPQKNMPPLGGAAGLATKGLRTAGPARRP